MTDIRVRASTGKAKDKASKQSQKQNNKAAEVKANPFYIKLQLKPGRPDLVN